MWLYPKMLVRPVHLTELAAIADLVNGAYRGSSSRQGWTHEADYLEGPRTDPQTLADALNASPRALLLGLAAETEPGFLGCVWIEPAKEATWYLGMLSIRPDAQARRLGRTLLEAGEAEATKRGARRIRLTVINIRDTLIAWYERRGYGLTGVTEPFPYADGRFGDPNRQDLFFVVLEKSL